MLVAGRNHMNPKPRSKAKITVLVATLAAVFAVLRIISTFPLVGVSGARFSASDSFASLYGVILGPYASAVCITLGTIIGFLIGRPPIFWGFDFMPAAVNGITLGLIIRGRRKYALLLYLMLLFLFVAHPYTQLLIPLSAASGKGALEVPFVWMHLLGLLILASPLGSKLKGLVASPSIANVTLGFSLSSFVGTLSQHLMGNLLYASMILPFLSDQARIANWTIIFWLYPIERLVIVAISTLIAVPIIRALSSVVSVSKSEGIVFAAVQER
jgi:hypothetical protein